MKRIGGYSNIAMLSLLAGAAALHPDAVYGARMKLESDNPPAPEVVAARLTKAEKKRERKNAQRLKLQSSGDVKP